MTCPHCGAEIEPHTKECPICLMPIGKDTAPSEDSVV
ncbi:MAG: zinc-ribbon domain-containing protein [Candidatus Hydrogenedentes bacterium]|nr:zinc-ribbon domain-containing protein [Candidatus Hydrogenedentota bacterium]